MFARTYGTLITLIFTAVISPRGLAAEHQQDAGYQGKVKFDTVDADANDEISPQEMTNWRAKKFYARDLNDDGFIDRQELIKIAKDGGRALTWDESSDFLLIYDADGDLIISQKEVVDKINGTGFFEILDYDFSGHITRLEAEGWLDITRTRKNITPSDHPVTQQPQKTENIPPLNTNNQRIGDLY